MKTVYIAEDEMYPFYYISVDKLFSDISVELTEAELSFIEKTYENLRSAKLLIKEKIREAQNKTLSNS